MNENRVVAHLSNSAGEKEQKYMFSFNEGWTFNGDFVKPTFTPSILVRSGHYMEGHTGDSCWCTYNAEHSDDPAPFKY
jgi:hypothetical protein